MALWKTIAGYEGRYMVSDEGEVYSLPKIVFGSWEQHRKGKLLKKGKRGRKGQPQVVMFGSITKEVTNNEFVEKIFSRTWNRSRQN